jgi:succinate dehydrogenase / fumarate reductase cytochrome b subunit
MKRPISPHLSIYKLDINALMSISHRISGVILFAGTVGLIKFLSILAIFPSLQPLTAWMLQTWFIQGILFMYAAALFYHTFNGIRHVLWDLNVGFYQPVIKISGWIIIGLTLFSTFLLWRAIYV